MPKQSVQVSGESLGFLTIEGRDYEAVRLHDAHNKIILINEKDRASITPCKTMNELIERLRKEGATAHEKSTFNGGTAW